MMLAVGGYVGHIVRLGPMLQTFLTVTIGSVGSIWLSLIGSFEAWNEIAACHKCNLHRDGQQWHADDEVWTLPHGLEHRMKLDTLPVLLRMTRLQTP